MTLPQTPSWLERDTLPISHPTGFSHIDFRGIVSWIFFCKTTDMLLESSDIGSISCIAMYNIPFLLVFCLLLVICCTIHVANYVCVIRSDFVNCNINIVLNFLRILCENYIITLVD